MKTVSYFVNILFWFKTKFQYKNNISWRRIMTLFKATSLKTKIFNKKWMY